MTPMREAERQRGRAAGRPLAWLSWSSGKDAMMALAAVRAAGGSEVTGLLTTVDETTDRVVSHGVRRELVRAQADRLGLPLHVVALPRAPANAVYEERMAAAHAVARQAGVSQLVFGDLQLQDVRAYREEAMAGSGIEPLFPAWGSETTAFAHEALAAGVRGHLACVDLARLDHSFAGRRYDEQLLADLPDGVDPCGENGEFHTVVTEGPGFAAPVACRPGGVVVRGGFAFADLLPGSGATGSSLRRGI